MFCNRTDFIDKLAWDSLVLVVLSQVIKWSTLDGGCTDFSRVLKPKIEKMGTLKKKWEPNGDPKSEKGPHGDPGPQMGTYVGAVARGTCCRAPGVNT